MPVVTTDITIYRGTAPAITFTRNVNGDQTGAVMRLSVRRLDTSPDPLVLDVLGSLTDNGSSSTPAVCVVSLSKASTLALTVGQYVFSLERVDPGNENLWNKGKMTVDYDVRNAK